MRVSQRCTGTSTRLAGDSATAAAIAPVISPIIASFRTMPMGPAITSAVLAQTRTAFSPVAAALAPAFSMAEVAMALAPTARTSASGSRARSRSTSARPMPPP